MLSRGTELQAPFRGFSVEYSIYLPTSTEAMPVKRPKKLTSKSTRMKALARQRVGPPKPGRAIEEKPARKKPKYKKNWQEEASGDDH
jgi:hypothetical protein